MAVNLSPLAGAGAQFFDNNGVILSGGKLYTYAAGTTTPLAAYTSSSGSTAHTNPIILDSAGRVPGGEIWITAGVPYKFAIYTALNVLLGTYDNLTSGLAGGVSLTSSGYTTATDVQTAFDNLGSTAGTSKVGFIATGTGAVSRSAQAKLRDMVSVEDFGAVGDGVTNDTVAIQAALNSGAASVQLTGKTYVVNGTLTIPPGVTLIGNSVASEYFPAGPGSTTVGSCLSKLSTGTAGPIVILQSSSGIANLYLKHSKINGATTGIVQVGLAGSNSVYNSTISNVSIYGSATADLAGTNTCYGIFYPNGSTPSTYQRYLNRADNFYIANCDVAIRLGANCNANNFTAFAIRQCYQHILLDGISATEQCVENVFSGFVCVNIGVLPTSATTVFVLKNYALKNVFSGYTTECNGSAFSIDTNSAGNNFFGVENETTLSVVPPNNLHSLFTQTTNRSQVSQMLIPAPATPQNYTFGTGNLLRFARSIGGTLPTLNSAAFTAADPSSKVIALFNSTVYAKSVKPGFKAKLTVMLSAPGGGAGQSIVSVEFIYRVTDNATNAAQLSVISVTKKPATNYIAGLKFLTGVASASGFGLAIVGGNFGVSTATALIVDLEILAYTYDVNVVAMSNYADITWTSIPATANNVTDAIDLLTVADTAI